MHVTACENIFNFIIIIVIDTVVLLSAYVHELIFQYVEIGIYKQWTMLSKYTYLHYIYWSNNNIAAQIIMCNILYKT